MRRSSTEHALICSFPNAHDDFITSMSLLPRIGEVKFLFFSYLLQVLL
jgi:hypothetical protein